jgi:hypothetical protein
MRYQFSWPAALVTASLLGAVAAPVFAQSLADVARQEAERRKHIAEPSKVYTDKDLKPAPPPTTPPPASDGAAAAGADTTSGDQTVAADATSGTDASGAKDTGAAGTDNAGTPAGSRTQAEWSAGMKERQDKLDRDQVLLQSVQNRIDSLTADFTSRDDPAQRDLIAQDRQRSLDELDRLRKDLASDRQAISDYEEEARRAGVPAGWLRN